MRRLTREARLVDPDLSPDGTRLAVVRTQPAGRELLILDATTLLAARTRVRTGGLPIVARLGNEGRHLCDAAMVSGWHRLAVERRRLHGPSEIAILNSDLSVSVAPLSSRGRNTTPDWTADGGQILFSLRLRRRTVRAVQGLSRRRHVPSEVLAPTGGALSAARTADGVVFVGYTVAGSDSLRGTPTPARKVPHFAPQPATSNRQPAIRNRQPDPAHNRQPAIRNRVFTVADVRAARLAAVCGTA